MKKIFVLLMVLCLTACGSVENDQESQNDAASSASITESTVESTTDQGTESDVSTDITFELSDEGVDYARSYVDSAFDQKPVLYTMFNGMHPYENSVTTLIPEMLDFYSDEKAAIGVCNLLQAYVNAAHNNDYSEYADSGDYFNAKMVMCEWLLATNHAYDLLDEDGRIKVIDTVKRSCVIKQGNKYKTDICGDTAWPDYVSGFVDYVKEAESGIYYFDDEIGFHEDGSEWYDYIMNLPEEYDDFKNYFI